MSIAKDIVEFACRIRPDQATLVPERRQEITTEGGLDVAKFERQIRSVIDKLKKKDIKVSLFINPIKTQIDSSARVGAGIIELHTGEYANAKSEHAKRGESHKLICACEYAISLGLEVNAGHGLNYENVKDVAKIEGINELNIGHSVISMAVFVGLDRAVREMLEIIR
jgi:pyridoxine 5-phosphate synthase